MTNAPTGLPDPLATRTRWLLAAAGLVIGAVGAVATFQTDNEIGTGALVVAGAFPLLVAALGFVPPFRAGPIELGTVVREARVDAVSDAVELARAEAAKPGATVDDVIGAAAKAAEQAVDRAWLVSEFGMRADGQTVGHTTKDKNGRIWFVQWKDGVPARAVFYANSMQEWGEQSRRTAQQDREDSGEYDGP